MANLTITVDDEVLRRARIRSLQRGTSVNALLREYLTAYAGDAPAIEALKEVIDMARNSNTGSGSEGRTWTRDELHDR
ncbi:MAG TPA: hypothetical protein VM425_11880 [Myxococcota bacterium]|nr:hypothetical protein [Myxococcota bacterium]